MKGQFLETVVSRNSRGDTVGCETVCGETVSRRNYRAVKLSAAKLLVAKLSAAKFLVSMRNMGQGVVMRAGTMLLHLPDCQEYI